MSLSNDNLKLSNDNLKLLDIYKEQLKKTNPKLYHAISNKNYKDVNQSFQNSFKRRLYANAIIKKPIHSLPPTESELVIKAWNHMKHMKHNRKDTIMFMTNPVNYEKLEKGLTDLLSTMKGNPKLIMQFYTSYIKIINENYKKGMSKRFLDLLDNKLSEFQKIIEKSMPPALIYLINYFKDGNDSNTNFKNKLLINFDIRILTSLIKNVNLEQYELIFTREKKSLENSLKNNENNGNVFGGSHKQYIKLQSGGKRLVRYGKRGGRYYMKGGNKHYIK